jgi:PhoPQ-activated pathogenicity-related protein
MGGQWHHTSRRIHIYGKGNWAQVLFLQKRIIPAANRVEFVSDRMLYIILRGPWFHIILPNNVHAPTRDKIDEMIHSFYEGLENIFDKFPKCHMKMLLGNFNSKVGKIFLNRQLEINVYMKSVMIMELE